MGLASKTLTLITGAAGLAIFSQAPEFAQQYYQRLAGAIDELRIVVNDFDKDASDLAMSREQALASLIGSPDGFSVARGKSMDKTISRFGALESQYKTMTNTTDFMRPVELLKYPDPMILKGTWSIFKLAVPVTSSGVIYGGAGALIAIILARLGTGVLGRGKKRGQILPGSGSHKIAVHDQVQHDEELAIELGLLEREAFKKYLKNGYRESMPRKQEPPLLEPISYEQKVHGEVDAFGKIIPDGRS